MRKSLREVGRNAFDGTAFIANQANWEDGALYIGSVLVKASSSISGSFEINERTVFLADGAFENCSQLETVVIPSGLQMIGKYCFAGCFELAEVRLPLGVKYIGEQAFDKWEGLPSGDHDIVYCDVYIPSAVEYIGGKRVWQLHERVVRGRSADCV